MKSLQSIILTVALFLSSGFLEGCSVLIGRVKPVEEKSEKVRIVDVPSLNPNWKDLQVSSAHAGTAEENEDIPDAAWQSATTAAVISINSSCRVDQDSLRADPRATTETLLSPWRNLKILSQKDVMVSGYPGIETSAMGIYLNRTRKFQLVVVKAPSCIYDMIFLSPPATYSQELAVFQQFRDNLKLK